MILTSTTEFFYSLLFKHTIRSVRDVLFQYDFDFILLKIKNIEIFSKQKFFSLMFSYLRVWMYVLLQFFYYYYCCFCCCFIFAIVCKSKVRSWYLFLLFYFVRFVDFFFFFHFFFLLFSLWFDRDVWQVTRTQFSCTIGYSKKYRRRKNWRNEKEIKKQIEKKNTFRTNGKERVSVWLSI